MLTDQTGYLDGVVHRIIFGWAYDSQYPDRALDVEVKINGELAGRTVANVFRSDLRDSGIGNGYHAFQIPIPEEIESVECVEVYIAGSSHRLAASSPEPIRADLNRPLPAAWQPVKGRHAYPNFFILGAAKSGTTSLHRYLSECPDIAMSNPKEPYFFEAQYRWGATHYFNRHFGHWKGEGLVGEARHRNLYLPHVPPRIHEYNPDARLVVILRNPVERAVSHWWHWYSRGEETLPLRAALEADLLRIREGAKQPEELYVQALYEGREREMRTYVDSGYYMQQIGRYIELFGAERLHTILFDDVVADPEGMMADTLRFLGVDESLAAGIAYPVCNPSLAGMLEHVDAETLAWLQAHYASHNEHLARFLGRPLDIWDSPFQEKIAAVPALTTRECRYESLITSPNI